jgi:hypothetical protein
MGAFTPSLGKHPPATRSRPILMLSRCGDCPQLTVDDRQEPMLGARGARPARMNQLERGRDGIDSGAGEFVQGDQSTC